MPVRLQIRRGTASQWTAANPVLAAGEIAAELDTGKYKIGNGSTAWNSLAYSSGAVGPQGPQGTAGFTILNGSGAPGAGTGVNGDFFIDTTNKAIYGPKAAGSWGSATSLLPSLGSTAAADLGTAAAGTSLNAARADHVHSSTIVNPTFTGVASFPDGSASAPSITNTGDTNTGILFPAADTVGIATAGTQRVTIDSLGRVIAGATINTDVYGIQSVTTDGATFSAQRFSADSGGPFLRLLKSRGALQVNSVVSSGDSLGLIDFRAADGTGYIRAAAIEAQVDEAPGTNDMPGRLMFYTTADGAASATERMRIDRNGLITGTGTSLGAWTAYTPTLGGTGWALGDGTVAGYYVQVGKTIHYRIRFTFGSTSTFGAGAPTISLPVAARNAADLGSTAFVGYLRDASAAQRFPMVGLLNTVNDIGLYSPSSPWAAVTSTAPFTFATSDQIFLSATYEAA